MVGKAISKKLLSEGYGDPNKNGCLLTPNKKELNLLDLERYANGLRVLNLK